MRVAFIREQQPNHSVRRLCKMMAVHPSGYYAWFETPDCSRAIEDKRLLGRIKQPWLESGLVYGYCKALDDLHAPGGTCGKHRV